VGRLIVAAVLLVGCVASLTIAPAAGAAGWSTPFLLEPTPPGFETFDTSGANPTARVAADARGDAIAVWVRGRDSRSGCCDDERVIASYRPAGGRFGKPEEVSRLGDEATEPDAAIDPAGNAFVVWKINARDAEDGVAAGGVGYAIRHAGAHGFAIPKTLSSKPGDSVIVTAGAVGQAVVAWEQLKWSAADQLLWPRRVIAAVQAGPTRFSRPISISGENAASDIVGGRFTFDMQLSAATDPSGATYLAWTRADGSKDSCCRAVEVTRRIAGGAFEPVSAASGPVPAEPENQPLPMLASRAGETLIAWAEGSTLVSRKWPARRSLESPATLALPQHGVMEALAMAANGTATALLVTSGESLDPLAFTLYAARRPSGGEFDSLQVLEQPGAEGALGFDSAGNTHAIWTGYTNVNCDRQDCRAAGPRIDAADAAPGGGFASFQTVASRDQPDSPDLAAVATGAVAGWLGDRGPWVAATGPKIGNAPVARAMRGPRVTGFRKRGARTFLFRVSRPARVLVGITRIDEHHEDIRRVGQTTVRVRRGPGHLTLPRRILLSGNRQYAATLIAQDATGHDSRWIARVFFRGR
jgi:hypothetical protein